MVRLLVILATLTLLVASLGCGTTPPASNDDSNSDGTDNNGDGNSGTDGPLTITGTVTDAAGTASPTLAFTGGIITVSATLGGTIPEGIVVSATIGAPQSVVAAQAEGTTITLSASEGTTYSGSHTISVNGLDEVQTYAVQVIATPTEGEAVTAEAGQVTVSAPGNVPPSPPTL